MLFKNILTRLAMGVLVLYLIWPKYLGFYIGNQKFSLYSLFSIVFFLCVFIKLIIWYQSKRLILKENKYSNLLPITWVVICIYELIVTGIGGEFSDVSIVMRNIFGVKILFLVGWILATNDPSGKSIITILRICILFSAVFAVMEYYSGQLLGLYLAEIGGFSSGDLVFQSMIGEKIRDDIFRVQSVFDHPILLGAVSAIGVVVVLSDFFANKKIKKINLIVYLSILIFTSFATGSRTALVGILFACAIYIALFIYLWFDKVKLGLWSISVLFLILVVIVTFFYDSIVGVIIGRTDMEAISSQMRDDMWYMGMPYIIDKPIIGWGAGSDVAYAGISQGDIFTIDDSYLTNLICYGFLGVILNAGFVLFVLIFSYGISKSKKINSDIYLGITFIVVVFIVLLTQKINSIPYLFGFIFLFGGFLGKRIFYSIKYAGS